MSNNEIHKVSDLIELISQTGLTKKGHSHLRIWYRGHEDETYQLKPGVYREEFQCASNEEQRLKKEQHLSQDFRIYSSGLREDYLSNSQMYFLQQHYGMPTRLLDWSNDPLTALFFAVNNKNNDDKRGIIYIMDTYQLTEHQEAVDKEGKLFRGIATGENHVFKSALNVINSWLQLENFPDFIIPVRSDYFDKRTKAQKSCFTFHVPSKPTLTSDHNKTLEQFVIPKEAKANLRGELLLLGVDHFRVYGDLESLSKTLKINYSN